MEQRRRPALQRHREIDTQFRRTRSGAARLISPFGRAQCTRRSLHVLTPEALMNPKAAEGLRYAFREFWDIPHSISEKRDFDPAYLDRTSSIELEW